MNYVKFFLMLVSLGISAAIYGAYYVSNISDLRIDVKIGTGEILKEKQIYEKYNAIAEMKSSKSETPALENTEDYEIFKKEVPEIKVIRTEFDKNKNIKPEKKITIAFSEEIDLYSLLGFKKVVNGEYKCDGKTIKSKGKSVRCNSENKIFINKIEEDLEENSEENLEKTDINKIFKGVVKKSEIDKKTIIISTKLEELENYEIKILSGVKGYKINELIKPESAENENNPIGELKNVFSVKFKTTDKDGNIKVDKVENAETNKVNDNQEEIEDIKTSGTGNISELENKTDSGSDLFLEDENKTESGSNLSLEDENKTESGSNLSSEEKKTDNKNSSGSNITE